MIGVSGPVRRLGVHASIAGGVSLSLERAKALGCSTIQIFSHNPRGWEVKELSREDVSAFRSRRLILDISPVFIHSSYLINMASRDVFLVRKSIELLIKEMGRADDLGADYVILHTGSASGEDARPARRRAVDALSRVAEAGRWSAGLLLENTAGRSGDISSRIEELAEMVNAVKGRLISGICFDTCHAYAAGYDVAGERGIRAVLAEVEGRIGRDCIKLVHLNDSKGSMGSHLDRHEHIGVGKIGTGGLTRFINHARLREVPLILETPKKQPSDDSSNLRKVREMIRIKRQFKK